MPKSLSQKIMETIALSRELKRILTVEDIEKFEALPEEHRYKVWMKGNPFQPGSNFANAALSLLNRFDMVDRAKEGTKMMGDFEVAAVEKPSEPAVLPEVVEALNKPDQPPVEGEVVKVEEEADDKSEVPELRERVPAKGTAKRTQARK